MQLVLVLGKILELWIGPFITIKIAICYSSTTHPKFIFKFCQIVVFLYNIVFMAINMSFKPYLQNHYLNMGKQIIIKKSRFFKRLIWLKCPHWLKDMSILTKGLKHEKHMLIWLVHLTKVTFLIKCQIENMVKMDKWSYWMDRF